MTDVPSNSRLRSVWFLWFNQINKMNQTNKTNAPGRLAEFFSILPGNSCLAASLFKLHVAQQDAVRLTFLSRSIPQRVA